MFFILPGHLPCCHMQFAIALHDAGARFAMPLRTGEAFGVRLSFLALSEAVVCACAHGTNHSTLKTKAAEGQPHSTTLARGRYASPYRRSFWSAPVFSGAFLCGGMSVRELESLYAAIQKRQKEQPHSTTLARDPPILSLE